jgi:hypothetical protein
MKTFTQIIADVIEYNKTAGANGKNWTYVPAEFSGDMVEHQLYSDSLATVLESIIDGGMERELRGLIATAVRNENEGAEFYTNALRVGIIICTELQLHADRKIRDTIDRRKALEKAANP